MKRIILFFLCFLLLPSMLYAGDAPNIPSGVKAKVQTAMLAHVNALLAKNGGSYPIFDPGIREVVQLNFKDLHKGVVVKGSQGKYYISCADFTDQKGGKYDLDFLVSTNFEVVETLVHKKNGEKIHYGVH